MHGLGLGPRAFVEIQAQTLCIGPGVAGTGGLRMAVIGGAGLAGFSVRFFGSNCAMSLAWYCESYTFLVSTPTPTRNQAWSQKKAAKGHALERFLTEAGTIKLPHVPRPRLKAGGGHLGYRVFCGAGLWDGQGLRVTCKVGWYWTFIGLVLCIYKTTFEKPKASSSTDPKPRL